MEYSKSAAIQVEENMRYVDRGDPAAYDFVHTDFIFDGAPHELDLSGIIPSAGANHLAHIAIEIEGNAGNMMAFYENGNSNNFNSLPIVASVTSQTAKSSGFVMLDADRKIQYAAHPDLLRASLAVRGWLEG